jgi:prepilin-type N-terminal cleavage/methylation domain-containing protein
LCRGLGYTLIELLIVIAILGISGALLVPYMVNRDTMNAQSAVRRVIGDLSFAQSDALAHQQLRRVHFYDDGHGYCVTRVTDADLSQPFNQATADYIRDPLAGPGSGGNYIVDFVTDERFKGIIIESTDIDGGGHDLHFDTLGGTIMAGGAPGTGGTIILASGPERYQITISPFTGKLTVVKL